MTLLIALVDLAATIALATISDPLCAGVPPLTKFAIESAIDVIGSCGGTSGLSRSSIKFLSQMRMMFLKVLETSLAKFADDWQRGDINGHVQNALADSVVANGKRITNMHLGSRWLGQQCSVKRALISA